MSIEPRIGDHAISRRHLLRLLAGVTLAFAYAGRSAAASPVRIIAKALGTVIKASGKAVKITVRIVVAWGAIVFDRVLGTYEVLVGKVMNATYQILGLAVNLSVAAFETFARVRAELRGVTGTVSAQQTIPVPA